MIRFTTVYELYLQQEDQAKAELGRVERKRAELLSERAVIIDRQRAASLDVAPTMHEQYLAFHRAQHDLIKRHDTLIAAQETLINTARDALKLAHQRCASIAKLRARDRVADAARYEKREQRRNDDRAATSISQGVP